MASVHSARGVWRWQGIAVGNTMITVNVNGVAAGGPDQILTTYSHRKLILFGRWIYGSFLPSNGGGCNADCTYNCNYASVSDGGCSGANVRQHGRQVSR